jgi:hypothetical protein
MPNINHTCDDFHKYCSGSQLSALPSPRRHTFRRPIYRPVKPIFPHARRRP